jgi:glycine cleavage system transcriptional repressor
MKTSLCSICIHTSHFSSILLLLLDSGKFTLEGADNPGIAHKLTTALSQHGLSIEKMTTDQEIAPHGGTVLFRMRGIAQAAAPLCKTFDAHRIRHELRALGDDLNCEVDLVDVTDDAYEASFVAG